MLSRRDLFRTTAVLAGSTAALSGYAVSEPRKLVVNRYRITPPGWPPELRLRIALVADLHVCEPWMNVDRIDRIVDRTNALRPDCTMLLGDYMPGRRILRVARPVAAEKWARALGRLRAPLGVHAVLGNHDWWDDTEVQRSRKGTPLAARVLADQGILVYENEAYRFQKDGRPFWIAGLGDQGAFLPNDHQEGRGTHDLPATLGRIRDDAPVVMMAHEPDIFSVLPARVSLMVAGHTHGGQVQIPVFDRVLSSYAVYPYRHGHIVERNRHLIVSSGLGCSSLPVRVGVPPEIVVVELGNWSPAAPS